MFALLTAALALALRLAHYLPKRADTYVRIPRALPALAPARDENAVNLNTATHAQLLTLPGIGDVLAAAILDARAQLGGFRYREELLHVPGIGQGKLHAIYDLIYVDEAESAQE